MGYIQGFLGSSYNSKIDIIVRVILFLAKYVGWEMVLSDAPDFDRVGGQFRRL